MEIEGYVLGPHYLWGQVLGCQQPLLGQGLLPSLRMANVGYWYVILCYGVPTTSVGARGKREQGEQEGARGVRGERGE